MTELDVLLLELAACEPVADTAARTIPPFAWNEDNIAAAFYRETRAAEQPESE